MSRENEATEPHPQGAVATAARLQKSAGDGVHFLFNRVVPGRPGLLEIIAIAPSGVHVIDTSHADDSVITERTGAMRGNLDEVRAAVLEGPLPDVPVRPAYCFVDADVPWGLLVSGGIPSLGLSGTARALARPGDLSPSQVAALRRHLAKCFPRSAPASGSTQVGEGHQSQ